MKVIVIVNNNFYNSADSEDSHCTSVPNFSKIGQCIAVVGLVTIQRISQPVLRAGGQIVTPFLIDGDELNFES